MAARCVWLNCAHTVCGTTTTHLKRGRHQFNTSHGLYREYRNSYSVSFERANHVRSGPLCTCTSFLVNPIRRRCHHNLYASQHSFSPWRERAAGEASRLPENDEKNVFPTTSAAARGHESSANSKTDTPRKYSGQCSEGIQLVYFVLQFENTRVVKRANIATKNYEPSFSDLIMTGFLMP